MLRFAAAALLLSASLLAATRPSAGPRGKPPSSLEPDQARGTVEFSHEHQRVVSCDERREAGEVVCKPKQESMDVGTALTLRPVDDAGRLSQEDRRSVVTLRFEDEPSPQKEEVELSVGTWELEWAGLRKRPRMRVAEEDEFKVKLSTLEGACKRVRSRCVVAPAAQRRTVSIPERYRAP
jgi:hypothetical protein